jgi:hypothetical protein
MSLLNPSSSEALVRDLQLLTMLTSEDDGMETAFVSSINLFSVLKPRIVQEG